MERERVEKEGRGGGKGDYKNGKGEKADEKLEKRVHPVQSEICLLAIWLPMAQWYIRSAWIIIREDSRELYALYSNVPYRYIPNW